jgi:hypothetical protein
MNETFIKLKRKLKLFALALLLGSVLIGVAYFEFLYHYSYSSGETVGYIQKLSLKGWICKTWEGELLRSIAAQPSVPEKFLFTVREDALAEKMNASIGERVILVYDQHLGLPGCFGDTDHFVVDVRVAPKSP